MVIYINLSRFDNLTFHCINRINRRRFLWLSASHHAEPDDWSHHYSQAYHDKRPLENGHKIKDICEISFD